jgi:hypothetical protein
MKSAAQIQALPVNNANLQPRNDSVQVNQNVNVSVLECVLSDLNDNMSLPANNVNSFHTQQHFRPM